VKIVKKRVQTKKKHKGQEKDFLTFLYIRLQVSIYDDIKKNKKMAKVVVCNGFFGATYHYMILATLKLGRST
jgi:thymidylate kinase